MSSMTELTASLLMVAAEQAPYIDEMRRLDEAHEARRRERDLARISAMHCLCCGHDLSVALATLATIDREEENDRLLAVREMEKMQRSAESR